MIKLMQFCNTFNLEFRIIPDRLISDSVSIRVERKEDKKVYQHMLLHDELYSLRCKVLFDFENYIFEKLVEEFHLDADAWKQLKQQWREQKCVL